MSELDPTTTTDTSFAAYLDYKHHKFVGFKRDPNDRKRMIYIFIKKDISESLYTNFYDGKVKVEPQRYSYSLKKMHRTLNDYLKGNNV